MPRRLRRLEAADSVVGQRRFLPAEHVRQLRRDRPDRQVAGRAVPGEGEVTSGECLLLEIVSNRSGRLGIGSPLNWLRTCHFSPEN